MLNVITRDEAVRLVRALAEKRPLRTQTVPLADALGRVIAQSVAAAEDVPEIRGYFENFREWMALEGRLGEYDFDLSCVAPDNYVYIKTKEGEPMCDGAYVHWKYDDYIVYYFDVATCILYYIHTNI